MDKKEAERYRTLFETMSEGFALHELVYDESRNPIDLRYLDVNQAFERCSKMKAAEIVGKSAIETFGAASRQWIDRIIQVAVSGDAARFAAFCPEHQLHFEISAYRTEPGRVAAVFFDVTEASSDIRYAYRFLDSVVENIPDMIFVKEAKDLRFVRFNKAGEDLLGYKREDLIGKNDYDFFPKTEADFFTSKDRAVLDGKKLLEIDEEPIKTRLKGPRILHTKKIPILDEKGDPIYLLGISEDVTEKKQAEAIKQQLLHEQIAKEEAQTGIRVRDDFISIVSHELKTPLTALTMQFQMLPRILKNTPFDGKEKFFELFQSSIKQFERFSKLVDELLDISRISAGRIVLETQDSNLSSIITRALDLYRADSERAGCNLVLNLDSTIVGCWDPTRVEQIVVNLLTNAIKYGAGKPIEISTSRNGDNAVLAVKDQGIGICPTDQAKIFDRFERAVPVTRYSGLGLGLYITREIVQAHGGMIRVESELEKGATFFVELPLKLKAK